MTYIISNENEKLKLGTIPSVRICQNMLEMALRCHHFAYKFLKFPRGWPPGPPYAHHRIFSNPPLLKPAYGPACIHSRWFYQWERVSSEESMVYGVCVCSRIDPGDYLVLTGNNQASDCLLLYCLCTVHDPGSTSYCTSNVNHTIFPIYYYYYMYIECTQKDS